MGLAAQLSVQIWAQAVHCHAQKDKGPVCIVVERAVDSVGS